MVADRVPTFPLLLAWVLRGGRSRVPGVELCRTRRGPSRSGGIYVFLREGFGPLPHLLGLGRTPHHPAGAYGAIWIAAAAYALRVFGLDPAAPVAGLPVQERATARSRFIILVWRW